MRRWLRILAFVLVTAVAGWLFWHFYNRGHRFFDLKIYMQAVRWWAHGNDLYAYAQPDFLQVKLYFTYPPFGALLLFPFGFLPLVVTEVLFTLGTIAAVIVTTIWIFRALELKLEWVWYAVPLILAMEPLRETIPLGQINMLLVVLILFDLLILGPRASRWTGVGIGLATAIKLTPGIFIVYLLLTRQWRAAGTAAATAAGVTLLTAAIAPRASWDFWTHALWDTARVGRTDITGNQSLLGLLHRLTAPAQPNRVLWLVLALGVLALGLWRATLAHRAGNEVAALALTGLAGALVSPITWPHHLYWFVPALAVCFAARRWWLLILGYAVGVIGVVSWIDYGTALQPTATLKDFLARNAFILLSVIFMVMLPIKRVVRSRSFRVTLT
jgi:alpha-1,2-mannosyltransferase